MGLSPCCRRDGVRVWGCDRHTHLLCSRNVPVREGFLELTVRTIDRAPRPVAAAAGGLQSASAVIPSMQLAIARPRVESGCRDRSAYQPDLQVSNLAVGQALAWSGRTPTRTTPAQRLTHPGPCRNRSAADSLMSFRLEQARVIIQKIGAAASCARVAPARSGFVDAAGRLTEGRG